MVIVIVTYAVNVQEICKQLSPSDADAGVSSVGRSVAIVVACTVRVLKP